MPADYIALSGLRAQMTAFDTAAANIAQLNVREPQVSRTLFRADAPPHGGPGGVRAETAVSQQEPAATAGGTPVLHPDVADSFAREPVDLVQQLTDALVARRAFQVNLAAQRTATAFFEATLKIGA